MLGTIISAFILCGTMYAVARHEADISFPVVLLIAFGVSAVSVILSLFMGLFSLPLVLVALAWALHQFCYLRWSRAWIVTGIYTVAQLGIGMAFAVLRSS